MKSRWMPPRAMVTREKANAMVVRAGITEKTMNIAIVGATKSHCRLRSHQGVPTTRRGSSRWIISSMTMTEVLAAKLRIGRGTELAGPAPSPLLLQDALTHHQITNLLV